MILKINFFNILLIIFIYIELFSNILFILVNFKIFLFFSTFLHKNNLIEYSFMISNILINLYYNFLFYIFIKKIRQINNGLWKFKLF